MPMLYFQCHNIMFLSSSLSWKKKKRSVLLCTLCDLPTRSCSSIKWKHTGGFSLRLYWFRGRVATAERAWHVLVCISIRRNSWQDSQQAGHRIISKETGGIHMRSQPSPLLFWSLLTKCMSWSTLGPNLLLSHSPCPCISSSTAFPHPHLYFCI